METLISVWCSCYEMDLICYADFESKVLANVVKPTSGVHMLTEHIHWFELVHAKDDMAYDILHTNSRRYKESHSIS